MTRGRLFLGANQSGQSAESCNRIASSSSSQKQKRKRKELSSVPKKWKQAQKMFIKSFPIMYRSWQRAFELHSSIKSNDWFIRFLFNGRHYYQFFFLFVWLFVFDLFIFIFEHYGLSVWSFAPNISYSTILYIHIVSFWSRPIRCTTEPLLTILELSSSTRWLWVCVPSFSSLL